MKQERWAYNTASQKPVQDVCMGLMLRLRFTFARAGKTRASAGYATPDEQRTACGRDAPVNLCLWSEDRVLRYESFAALRKNGIGTLQQTECIFSRREGRSQGLRSCLHGGAARERNGCLHAETCFNRQDPFTIRMQIPDASASQRFYPPTLS